MFGADKKRCKKCRKEIKEGQTVIDLLGGADDYLCTGCYSPLNDGQVQANRAMAGITKAQHNNQQAPALVKESPDGEFWVRVPKSVIERMRIQHLNLKDPIHDPVYLTVKPFGDSDVILSRA